VCDKTCVFCFAPIFNKYLYDKTFFTFRTIFVDTNSEETTGVKVKFTLEIATKDQMGIRGIALVFL